MYRPLTHGILSQSKLKVNEPCQVLELYRFGRSWYFYGSACPTVLASFLIQGDRMHYLRDLELYFEDVLVVLKHARTVDPAESGSCDCNRIENGSIPKLIISYQAHLAGRLRQFGVEEHRESEYKNIGQGKSME